MGGDTSEQKPILIESMHDVMKLLGRERPLFAADLKRAEAELSEKVRESSFLVLGGAGSIGQAVAKELFRHHPRRLHVVDISENNLVELVRDIRSSHGYNAGELQVLPLDVGGPEFESFLRQSGPYDYVLNFSALKHVRSEKDPFTLMRMIRVNVLNTERTLEYAARSGTRRYFAVASDKAANPANAMGATKRVMELCLVRASERIEISSARFANVAFSDGSLPYGFTQRLAKRQPLAAPADVRRYFITHREAATLSLMSCLFGGNRETFFPKTRGDFKPTDFRVLTERFLEMHGYRAYPCETENEARSRVEELAARGQWPCYFFASDTTGEKELEEFQMDGERVDLDRFEEIGVILWDALADTDSLDGFLLAMSELQRSGRWRREELLGHLKALLPEFRHQETGKFLDSKM